MKSGDGEDSAHVLLKLLRSSGFPLELFAHSQFTDLCPISTWALTLSPGHSLMKAPGPHKTWIKSIYMFSPVDLSYDNLILRPSGGESSEER